MHVALNKWGNSTKSDAALDKGKSIHAVFLNFAKAFDSVPLQRLLIKLDHIAVRGQVLKWIESFLTGRLQRVVVMAILPREHQ